MCGWVYWVCDVTKERLGEVKSTSKKSRCNQMFQGFPIALVKPSPVTVTGTRCPSGESLTDAEPQPLLALGTSNQDR
jgi:hypothetical protein